MYRYIFYEKKNHLCIFIFRWLFFILILWRFPPFLYTTYTMYILWFYAPFLSLGKNVNVKSNLTLHFAPIIYSLTLRFIRSIHKSFGYNIFFMAYNCYPNIFLFWPKWKSEVIFSKLRLSVSVLAEITSRNEMIRKQNEKKFFVENLSVIHHFP